MVSCYIDFVVHFWKYRGGYESVVKAKQYIRENKVCLKEIMHLSMFSPRVGGGGYLQEIDSASFPLGRDFDS